MTDTRKPLRARDKIQPLEQLAATLESARASGSTIVHCHGVFDLLHIGHIRYFEQARQMGTMLVVTVTPDRYVNKGPHRPAFGEELRAEAIAALDCVDYVAINQWPTAVETIHMLRPHRYVKGPDYRDPSTDHTGGITLEKEAIEAVGGQLMFTDDITFSASSLINRHLSAFPRETSDYLAGFSARHSIEEVLGYLQRAQPLRVLVVGEAIIDEYQYCEAIGKSSKEPMLALRHLSTERFAGGILAVANHLADFCDQVSMVTFLGAEKPHEEFVREQLHPRIEAHLLYQQHVPTIVKRRFIERYFFTKLLEVYEMSDDLLDSQDNQQLCAILREQVQRADVVIVIDFGHGMLTPEARDILCEGATFLAVNAQSNAGNMGFNSVSRYRRADYICMAEKEVRMEARDRHGDLREMVLDIARQMTCSRMVVTRGKYGCLCYSQDEGFFEVPALAGQVIDRMGAGDAFLSLTAPSVAQGAPMEVVGFIGNAVGAQAVATTGHAQYIQRSSLFKHIESLLK